MATGVLLLATGDVSFAYFSLDGSWHPGHPTTVGWIVGYPLMLVGAARATRLAVAGESPGQTRMRVLLLIAPVVLAVAVTLADEGTRPGLLAVCALFALVLLRQTWSLFAELRTRTVLEEEISAQTRALRVQAYQDQVTGLGNRALLRERAAPGALRLESSALLLLDLDGFKEVNDSLGHAAGDAVLLQVGGHLGQCVRSADTVVRLGGDEFAVLLPDTGAQAAVAVAERMLTQIREPLIVSDVQVRIAGSIGIALGTAGCSLDEMLRNADLAMYDAKAAGRDQARLFQPSMHDHAAKRLHLDGEVRAAVTNGEFTVYYQPIINATTGTTSSVEALVRWDHLTRGVVPPSEFLPVAERNGTIVELGRFVLATACAYVHALRQDWPDLSVSVNASHRELLDPAFPATVERVLGATGLPPHALNLEITETVLAAESDIVRVLESLAALGVTFSIDDFGTGHSSLSRLRDLPVDRLKIDRSFVREICDGTAPLLSSIVALAHSLGRTVVAEGVETPEQRQFLVEQGCDELQGYLFSRPVPAQHLVPALRTQHGPGVPAAAPAPASELPQLVAGMVGSSDPDEVLPALLRELTALSGLHSAFATELDGAERLRVHAAHNSEPPLLQVPEGFTTDWSRSLCRRFLEDDLRCEKDVPRRYGDVEGVSAFGIATFVSVPVLDATGQLRGTLCAASSEPRDVEPGVVELMELVARALAERVEALPSTGLTSAARA